MPHPLLHHAVHNNARWIDTVCRTHGNAGTCSASMWHTTTPTPQFYPQAVTLQPDAIDEQMALLREMSISGLAPGWGVKDSYGVLDLHPLGFTPLFDATWIGMAAPARAVHPEGSWQPVRTADALAAWEAAWRGPDAAHAEFEPIFLPALLEDRDVAILAAQQNGQIVAGAIANRTGDVVGLSNLFVPAAASAQFREACIAAIGALFPAAPIVGYEANDDIPAFAALGFAPLGPLRVWLAGGA